MVYVWCLDFEHEPSNVEGYSTYHYNCLSAGERERATRYRFDQDRARFVLSRAALRLILGNVLEIAPRDIVITYGRFGKPYVRDAAVSFNLSHSTSQAIVAVSASAAVGVDVEPVRRIEDSDAFLSSILTGRERQELSELTDINSALLRAWTRKEALAKAIGVGLSVPPSWFDLSLRVIPALYAIASDQNAPVRWTLLDISSDGHVAALAVAAPRAECTVNRVSIRELFLHPRARVKVY